MATWDAIDYAGPSACDMVESIGGASYRREVIRLAVHVERGAINRETVRDALAALLSSSLVGTGKPVQAIYGYPVGDFGGSSPVVVVASAGTERKRLTFQGSGAVFFIDVFVFVLYTDRASWNEDSAEDRLDLIEKTIADVIDANQQA